MSTEQIPGDGKTFAGHLLRGNFKQIFQHDIPKAFKKLPSVTQAAVSIAYTAVNALKAITDFDQADLIGSVFGQFGKTIEDKARASLPEIVIQLQLYKDAAGTNDPNEIVATALQTIQKLDPKFQAAFWHDLAVYIAQLAADGDLSWGDAVQIVQWYYEHKKLETP